jgi:hypothetical protein
LPEVTGDYKRQEYEILSTTTSLVFDFSPEDALAVYHNGVLLSEGSTKDYTLDSANDLVIFTSPIYAGDRVSIMSLLDQSRTVVAGLMLEGNYSDPQTGMIYGSRIQFEDDQIPQAKVYGLAQALTVMASMTVSATSPATPTLFWLNTSTNPARMMFWDGVRYLPTSGDLDIPAFAASDALKFIQVDGTGSFLQYGSVDLSGLISVTQKGAATGVATLGSDGRLVSNQLPSPRNRRSISTLVAGSITDSTYSLGRIFMNKVQIVGFSGRLDTGTATGQIAVNGVEVGPTFSLAVTPNETTVASPIAINALSSSANIGITITSASAATVLDAALVIEDFD